MKYTATQSMCRVWHHLKYKKHPFPEELDPKDQVPMSFQISSEENLSQKSEALYGLGF
jgi:hypothetical protein